MKIVHNDDVMLLSVQSEFITNRSSISPRQVNRVPLASKERFVAKCVGRTQKQKVKEVVLGKVAFRKAVFTNGMECQCACCRYVDAADPVGIIVSAVVIHCSRSFC